MSDIWSNVGGSFTPQGEDWLYQKGGQVHGPVPKQVIVDKLMRGDMDPKTQVAKEGGEFHPISQVAAFQPDLEALNKIIKKRAASKMRLVMLMMVIVLGGVGAGAWFYFQQESQKRKDEIAAEVAAKEAKLKAAAEERRKLINSDEVALVALVSFDESAMKVGGGSSKSSKPKGGKKPKGGTSKGGEDKGEPAFMSQCQRDNQAILSVLAKNLRKINVCVEDEKKRSPGQLPPVLKLSFVATPGGSVSEFTILDRHYRTGPMRNCMLKVFRQIRYPPVGGSNCPVQIPIKIGG